jgi:hypothetical protein
MGRPSIPLDTDLMLQLLTDGMTKKDVAAIMGVSPMTIDHRISDLKKEESMLLAYDKVHYLDLIKVKEKLVAGCTQEKIDDAPLGQIAQAYGVFSKMEQLIQGRPTEIHGLMGYLLHLEKEDIAKREKDNSVVADDAIDVTVENGDSNG